MIRVVIRHIDYDEGILVGDFPPDQVDEVLELIRANTLYGLGRETDYCCIADDLPRGPTQFVVAGGKNERLVLEIIVEDDSDN